jgi:membrane-associated protease RseP (regulator of RpoE activity)
MASLSLYFLNLLPIPYLDGMELFKCVRAWVSERRERRGGREGVEMEEG